MKNIFESVTFKNSARKQSKDLKLCHEDWTDDVSTLNRDGLIHLAR